MIEFIPRTKVLWIEDSTHIDLAHLIPPVRLSGKYDLTIARNATEAFNILKKEDFAIIIFDLDLLPGSDPLLQEYYRHLSNPYHNQRPQETLGAILLYLWITGTGINDSLPIKKITKEFKLNKQLRPDQVGIISVYANDLKNNTFFDKLKINKNMVIQKSYNLSRKALLNLIEEIEKQLK